MDSQDDPVTALLDQLEVQTRPLQHLPLVVAVAEQIGIVEALDRLFPKDPRTPVSDTQCVLALLCHILSRPERVALYRTSEWLQGLELSVLFGVDLDADMFTDQRLAMALDHIDRFGTDESMSEVARVFLAKRPRETAYCVRTDLTSLALFGAYEGFEHSVTYPMPARGYSKDHRPDLKQLLYGLALHGPTTVPLLVHTAYGNTAEQDVYRFQIEQMASLLPPQDEVTWVGDSKLCDPVTLGQLLDEDFHVITLLPKTYAVRKALIAQVLEGGLAVAELGEACGGVYRGVSLKWPFELQTPRDGKQERQLRFLVVQSPSLEQRFEDALPEKLEQEEQRLRKAVERLADYACEADARGAIPELVRSLRWHQAHFEVQRVETPKKRAKRGRPRKDEVPEVIVSYRLVLERVQPDASRVEQLQSHARFFVLLTSHLDAERWPDARILAEYRQQHHAEQGFRWLKGPAAVAPLLLKTPQRLAAMGLVFALALMVRNYIEHIVRHRLVEQKQTLPYYGRKKPVENPTAEVIFHAFAPVQLEVLTLQGRVARRTVKHLSDAAQLVLDILGITPEVFSRVRNSSCTLPQPTE
jgi:transposase